MAILRVVNREDEREDRVVARVRMRVHRDPKRSAMWEGDQTIMALRTVHLDERWTLAHRRDQWFVVSVSGDPLTGPVLSAPLIASPMADTERLREASLRELTSKRRSGQVSPAELADPGAPPATKLLDLAVADDRFSPLLLASALAHLIEAWEEASDGSVGALDAIASKKAIDSLLAHSHGKQRLFIRDAALKHWELTNVDEGAEPPTVDVAVTVTAAYYVLDGDRVQGSDREQRELKLTWTLALRDRDKRGTRWRLLSSRVTAS